MEGETSNIIAHDEPPKKKFRKNSSTAQKSGFLSKARSEEITQALTKLVATARLPYSFASSEPFTQFMSVIEPNYKVPSSQTIVNRLRAVEAKVKNIIENELTDVEFIALDTDCWTSRSQDGYMNVNAHIITKDWREKEINLCTEELEEQHTAENLADALINVATQYGINDKLVAVTNDNASNIVKAVNIMENVQEDVGCAAHKIHLAVKAAVNETGVKSILLKASKIVSHFRHSTLASKNLQKMQEQLKLDRLKLVQSVSTRWNSDLEMAERLIVNRNAICNVLADKAVINRKKAESLEMLESEWGILEIIIEILRPLSVATKALSSSKLASVNPIMYSIINKHLKPGLEKYEDDEYITAMINKLIHELSKRFCIDSKTATLTAKCSFFDPRYKQLKEESALTRAFIKSYIIEEMEPLTPMEAECTERMQPSALDFIFNPDQYNNTSSVDQQIHDYLSQPELDWNADPLQWWRNHEKKYPQLSRLAKKYLCIPATSVSSERVFSTAGNIVTPRRNCLSTNNVATNVFLYQNRCYLDEVN